jgi:hypothetical protein
MRPRAASHPQLAGAAVHACCAISSRTCAVSPGLQRDEGRVR